MGCCFSNAGIRLVNAVELDMIEQAVVLAGGSFKTIEELIAEAGCLSCHGSAYLAQVEVGLWCLIRELGDPTWDCADHCLERECQCPNAEGAYRQRVEQFCAMLNGNDAGYSCDFETRLAAAGCVCASEYQFQLARLVALLDLENALGGTAIFEIAALVGQCLNPKGTSDLTAVLSGFILEAGGGFPLPLDPCDAGASFDPLAGACDTMECYASGVLLNALAKGSGFAGAWMDSQLNLGIQSFDTYDTYSTGVNLDALNDGDGWTTAWADGPLFNGLQADDSFDSYADDVFLDGLSNGEGFVGAWADGDLDL